MNYPQYPPLSGALGHVLCFSVDPFTKKDWYDVKAPSMFNIRQIGKTLVTRTQGTSKSPQYFNRAELRMRGAIEDNSKISFLFLKNICCDPSLEPSRRDGSNDRSQNMFYGEMWLIIPVIPFDLEHCRTGKSGVLMIFL